MDPNSLMGQFLRCSIALGWIPTKIGRFSQIVMLQNKQKICSRIAASSIISSKKEPKTISHFRIFLNLKSQFLVVTAIIVWYQKKNDTCGWPLRAPCFEHEYHFFCHHDSCYIYLRHNKRAFLRSLSPFSPRLKSRAEIFRWQPS